MIVDIAETFYENAQSKEQLKSVPWGTILNTHIVLPLVVVESDIVTFWMPKVELAAESTCQRLG